MYRITFKTKYGLEDFYDVEATSKETAYEEALNSTFSWLHDLLAEATIISIEEK